MKRFLLSLLLISVCSSVSFGAFDYVISDTYEYGIFTVTFEESLLVTGAGANAIEALGSSYIEVRDTAPLQNNVGGIYNLDLEDFSTANYYGGETSAVSIYDHATAIFSGGSINYIASFQDSDIKKHITFICDIDSVDLTGDQLTGNWLDGSSFSVTLLDQTDYDSVYSNIQFIPEPATLLLFGVGGVILRKRRC